MSTTKPVIKIKESMTFTLNEADLTGKKVGEILLTPKREIVCSGGLQWWMSYRPAGETEECKGNVSVYLWVNKSVKSEFTLAVDGSSINRTLSFEFRKPPQGYGWPTYASHEKLRPLFRDGKLNITCSVEFDISEPTISVPRVFQLFEHVPMDVEFAIESKRVPAHKYFLLLISSVFQAMFTHDTVESKTGIIDITEFDFDTVKAAMDICYGRETTNLPVDTIVGVLRFCDKYFITAVINELEKQPLLYPSVKNFSAVVQYAYDCNKDALLIECYKFFKAHQDKIKTTEKFAKLPLTLVITVIKSAFGLETDLEVLCHAKNNDIDFVVSHLENTLVERMTLDNFCDVVTYSWNCSLDDLQQSCAKFLNEHRDEVMDLEALHNLPSDVFANLFKASYVLKQRQEII